MAVTIIYETHSTTVDNETGRATGWLPGELSEQGIRNAQALGERRRERDLHGASIVPGLRPPS